jgi:hypothetical protein
VPARDHSLARRELRAGHAVRVAGEQLGPLRLGEVAAGDLAGIGLPGVGARVSLEDLAGVLDDQHPIGARNDTRTRWLGPNGTTEPRRRCVAASHSFTVPPRPVVTKVA